MERIKLSFFLFTRRKEMTTEYFEHVQVMGGSYKNFAGGPDRYHKNSQKPYFHIIVDEATANALREAGMNVKTREPKEEGDKPIHFIKLFINFDVENPRLQPTIYRIPDDGSNRRKKLDKDMLVTLDKERIKYADLKINLFSHQNGVTGYTMAGYFVVDEDRFDAKYSEYEEY